MLTAVQKEIMQSLINLYRQSKCTSVKCESIAELMGRNSGTIRNQMQSLRSLGLVQGVPGPRGGYKPTLEAYQALNVENDPCEIHVPIFVDDVSIPDISVSKIEFTNILRPGDCEATVSVLGNIKQLDLDDKIKIGPTPVNNLTVNGTIIGRDDVDNALLIKTNNIISIPNIQIKEIASPITEIVGLNDSLVEICKLMSDNNIECAVVMEDDEVMGIVDYTSIIKTITEGNIDKVVKDFIDEKFVIVKETNSLMHSMDMLYENNVSILLLMNDNEEIVKIVTLTDILRRLVKFTN